MSKEQEVNAINSLCETLNGYKNDLREIQEKVASFNVENRDVTVVDKKNFFINKIAELNQVINGLVNLFQNFQEEYSNFYLELTTLRGGVESLEDFLTNVDSENRPNE